MNTAVHRPETLRRAGFAFAGIAVGAVATALFLPRASTSCDVALDAAEEIFAVQADMTDDLTVFLGALADNPLDWHATEAFTADISTATDRLNGIDYQTPAATCRGLEG